MSHKHKISVTIDANLDDWIEEMVKNKVFASKSHAIEYCVNFVKTYFGNRVLKIMEGR